MLNLIELEKNNDIKVLSTIIKYNKPDKIYIPIIDTLLVKTNDLVWIGTPLFSNQNITSSISGKVQNIKNMLTLNGLTKTLEITNDYQEVKLIPKQKIALKNINLSKLKEILLNNFNLEINTDTLILNCLDDEPYVLTEAYYLFYYYEEFLELLDYFAKIYHLNKVIICLKSSNGEQISKLMEWIGMYPNISLEIIPNLYLISNNSYLLQYLEITNATIIKASLFYDIFNLIKRNRFKTDKLITISGDALINPMLVKVKIGTKLEDVINNLVKLKDNNVIYYANGLMQGKVINIKDFIITSNLNGLIIMLNKENKKEDACLKCGACSKVCPVKLKPYLFTNKNYLNQVKDTCLKCGLCTYICPSYIDFNKYIGGNNE